MMLMIPFASGPSITEPKANIPIYLSPQFGLDIFGWIKVKIG